MTSHNAVAVSLYLRMWLLKGPSRHSESAPRWPDVAAMAAGNLDWRLQFVKQLDDVFFETSLIRLLDCSRDTTTRNHTAPPGARQPDPKAYQEQSSQEQTSQNSNQPRAQQPGANQPEPRTTMGKATNTPNNEEQSIQNKRLSRHKARSKTAIGKASRTIKTART